MQIHLTMRLASIACAFVACISPLQANASTYTPYLVATSSGSVDNIGLTSTGTLVIQNVTNSTTPYTTFTPPSTFTNSATLPSLAFNNGSSCTLTGYSAFTFISGAVCNNGLVAFNASANGTTFSLYNGPDPLANLVYSGSRGVDNILLNSRGDIAFVATTVFLPTGGGADENFLYINSTVPEPSSLLLLGTGLLGGVSVLKRRFAVSA